ncbi:MAG: acyltransferase family protein [Gammaproteobacteria bacterium]
MAALGTTAGNGERLHALDAVRAFALLLGVVHHATLSFIPGAVVTLYAPVEDVSPSVLLMLVSFVGHNFRLPLFFMMAGFFAQMMVRRRGVPGFWADRLQRVLVPLIVGWAVFYPCVVVIWNWGFTGHFERVPIFSEPVWLGGFPLSYFWFLYYLLVFYALALGVRSVVLWLDTRGGLRRAADRLVREVVEKRWAGLPLLSVPVAAGLLSERGWSIVDGIVTPNHSLIPQLLPLLGYGLAFSLGWMVRRNEGLLNVWRDRWKSYLAMAVLATFLTLCTLALRDVPAATAYLPLERRVFVVLYALASWCWVFGLTGFALRFLNRPSVVCRSVADASYWIYLVHYPLVLASQVVLSGLQVHWALKFVAILAVTLTIALVSYRYLVRPTFIGAVLNGRRLVGNLQPPAGVPAKDAVRSS